jgi:hypothetical protein
MQNMQYIFCACGVRLNTQQDGVNLANMKAALQSVLAEHKYGGECEGGVWVRGGGRAPLKPTIP